MKLAVFHNYMDNIGGAERVGLTLARELNADIYSTVVNQKAIENMGFKIKVKKISWIPVNAPFRQQAALMRFRMLDLSKKYDYFIIQKDDKKELSDFLISEGYNYSLKEDQIFFKLQ
jgi:hypothetical protein